MDHDALVGSHSVGRSVIAHRAKPDTRPHNSLYLLLGISVLGPDPYQDDSAAVLYGCLDQWTSLAAHVHCKSFREVFRVAKVVAGMAVSRIKVQEVEHGFTPTPKRSP